ncbi:MAG TPA: protein-disulfide reductase DsbD [Candidatus Elarobacter sp.]
MRLIALLLCVCAATATAADLLEPEKAFRFTARALDDGAVEVHFAIADGYYLYRERFKFSAEGNPSIHLGVAEFPKGIPHKDEFFGSVETYRKQVAIRLPVEGTGQFDLNVTSQGCADAGVCYVPMDSKTTLTVAASGAGTGRVSIFASDTDIARLFEGNVLLVVASFFGFGVLLAFTPCMLPMIPILSSIIAGEGRAPGKMHAFALSLAYVLGMSLTYAVAGIAAGFSGTLLASALQNAWVLGGFALVFVALALSMFGLYELRLPGFLHQRLHGASATLKGGRVASVAAMGVLSAVIVSPCVAAPLAGALLYISQTRDVVLGGSALFTMALGMGIPLIVMGVSEGALLPKAGAWMEGVRRFFGVLLLAVALWIASPIFPASAQMFGWAALLIGSAVFLRALDPLPPHASGWCRLWKGAGVMALLIGAAMLAGALAGSRDPLRPLAGVLGDGQPELPATPWTRVASIVQLDENVKAAGRPAMLDFYADWCVSCKEMERFTFSDPRVRREMEVIALLQADVTANTEAHRALLKRFSLFGPPGIIFFDAQGREIPGLRVIGYQPPERFLKTLAAAAGR